MDDANDKRAYPCATCGKAFKRSEHRARHQRAHTQERPFSCRFCRRCYARRDLVVRHERTLHHDQYSAAASASVATASPQSLVAPTADQSPKGDLGTDSVDVPLSVQNDDDFRAPEPSLQPSTIVSQNISRHVEVARPAQVPVASSPCRGDAIRPTNTVNRGSLEDFCHLMSSTQHLPTLFETLDDVDILGAFEDVSIFPTMSADSLATINPDIVPGSDTSHSPLYAEPTTERPFPEPNLDIALSLPSPAAKDQSAQGRDPDINSWDPVHRNLPRITNPPVVRPQLPPFRPVHRSKILLDLELYLGQDGPSLGELPSTTVLQELLQNFSNAWMIHLPFIHIPTLDLDTSPPPLILSMCAIGALYCLDPPMSTKLYLQANKLLSHELSKFSRREFVPSLFIQYETLYDGNVQSAACPLWMVQSKLMLTFFETFTGNHTMIKRGLENVGFLVNVSEHRIGKMN